MEDVGAPAPVVELKEIGTAPARRRVQLVLIRVQIIWCPLCLPSRAL